MPAVRRPSHDAGEDRFGSPAAFLIARLQWAALASDNRHLGVGPDGDYLSHWLLRGELRAVD
jgi:hypothetical protein